MSQALDSPRVVLFEDRPKQNMVFQLNLSIYLDARVVNATSLKDLSKALEDPAGVQLVVVRGQFKGNEYLPQVMDFLTGLELKIPVICLGAANEEPGVTIVPDTEVKPMLQNAAKILGITAQKMVAKPQPETFPIQPEFMNMLFTFPCDVFEPGKGLEAKLFAAGDTVNRAKVAKYVRQKKTLVIDPYKRLKLVNAVTEQALKASEDLLSDKIEDTQKMSILASSLDMVAAQFQSAGMDEETVKLANASIKAVEKIAESATSVGNLVKQLMAAEGGYRYAHCQLVTFLGFHVIKMMGWWGDDQRNTISQAAFYHDISLSNDDQCKIRSDAAFKAANITDPAQADLILSHPHMSARELQNGPDIPPLVVKVVLQHHGMPTGRGFSTDIGNLDNLAKTFILSEEWCDYLIDLDTSDKRADTEGKIKELKAIYKDDVSQQIVETFRYLDAEQFEMDFLSTKEVEFATSLISGSEEAQSVVVGADGTAQTPETLVKGGPGEDESETTLKGVTDHTKLDEIKVGGGAPTPEQAAALAAFEPKEPKRADVARTPGPAGDKARALLAKIQEKKPNATPEEVEKLLAAGGVEITPETVALVGQENDDAKKKISGVTAHIGEDTERRVGGAGEENGNTKVGGVTEHMVTEQVVKGDGSQQLVDRTITRIKADEKERDKELKMKALAGSTELMKAALGGALEKVTEILTASTIELKKTDAEGRTSIHYAAMGGSLPVLKFLIEKGAALNTVDSKRRSPLFLAAMYKQIEAFDFLLAQGAKINQQAMGGMTIAMVGANAGNLHVLKAAVERGVRLDTKDHGGKTALDYAKQAKAAEAIAFIEASLPAKPGAKPAAKAA